MVTSVIRNSVPFNGFSPKETQEWLQQSNRSYRYSPINDCIAKTVMQLSKAFQAIWNRAVIYVGRSDLQYADVKIERLCRELEKTWAKADFQNQLNLFGRLIDVKPDQSMVKVNDYFWDKGRSMFPQFRANKIIREQFKKLPKHIRTAICHRIWVSLGSPTDKGNDFGKDYFMNNPRSKDVRQAIVYLQNDYSESITLRRGI